VTWSVSRDVHTFLAAAGAFLSAHPVDNTALLTEAAYLTARPSTTSDQLYAWWRPADGGVEGAFLQAPRHPPILSMMPDTAVESLADILTGVLPIGVDARLADAVGTAWRRHTGTEPRERSRITLYRLGRLLPPSLPPGRARTATADDRELLVSWFEQLMRANPGDPSDLAYVVDDPISYGGITLWEVGATPVAMAGRSRLTAGMVRLSAVYAPEDDAYADAAFVAACTAAEGVARDVLVFAPAADTASDTAYRQLGLEPVLQRVMLGI
jgi:hypothetical protein